MSNSIDKIADNEESQNSSLLRGSIGFFGGLLLCGAAILAQAALLHAVKSPRTNSN